MLRKLSLILGIAIMLSSTAAIGTSQTDSTEHHTGVKRTYLKAKHKVKKAWNKTKSTVGEGADSVKAKARRVKPDDEKH